MDILHLLWNYMNSICSSKHAVKTWLLTGSRSTHVCTRICLCARIHVCACTSTNLCTKKFPSKRVSLLNLIYSKQLTNNMRIRAPDLLLFRVLLVTNI